MGLFKNTHRSILGPYFKFFLKLDSKDIMKNQELKVKRSVLSNMHSNLSELHLYIYSGLLCKL